jgi:hypothetical protein
VLHKAVHSGHQDAAYIAKDSDLDSLRDRENFKKANDGTQEELNKTSQIRH